MEEFYKELLEREEYLKSLEETETTKAQLHELALCIVRVQQILLSQLKGKSLYELAEKHWEGCDGCDEHDKNFWINGFMSGYNFAK